MSNATGNVTRNANLLNQLRSWVLQLEQSLALPTGSPERLNSIINFCKNFVPLDVSEADTIHYANTLANDEEFFISLYRDVCNCATGERVESIAGNQSTRALFTVLPPEDLVSGDFELVREVAFVSLDRGATWTAEG